MFETGQSAADTGDLEIQVISPTSVCEESHDVGLDGHQRQGLGYKAVLGRYAEALIDVTIAVAEHSSAICLSPAGCSSAMLSSFVGTKYEYHVISSHGQFLRAR